MTVMQATPYGHVLYGLEIVCGILLIAGVFVPVALTILAGYIFNIYMFRIFPDPSLSPWPVIVTVLWIFMFVRYRHAFRALLLPRAPAPNRGEEQRFTSRLESNTSGKLRYLRGGSCDARYTTRSSTAR
jgi:hypothetical protein